MGNLDLDLDQNADLDKMQRTDKRLAELSLTLGIKT